ncbi:MAG: hypothetical protein LBT29_08825 [Flavobacteriaceae bacterium]|jgi:hypothetical protein|nr:hypothetical protein [Flavobacteriaceae bacterium]
MILLYFETQSGGFFIDKKNALPASETQVLEIFSKIRTTNSDVLGLKPENEEIRISSFNKFLWEIQISHKKPKKTERKYYSTEKVKLFIHEIFNDLEIK